MANVTVRVSLFIAAPPERVWDFTQDWSRRADWDPAIVAAERIEAEPPAYRVRGAGGVRFVARYKLYDRPRRTSLEMAESTSRLIGGGGGSWAYEPEGAGTNWTQNNTLTVKNAVLYTLLRPLLSWQLRRVTRAAMTKAKELIEAG